jgi:hypothetical protein
MSEKKDSNFEAIDLTKRGLHPRVTSMDINTTSAPIPIETIDTRVTGLDPTIGGNDLSVSQANTEPTEQEMLGILEAEIKEFRRELTEFRREMRRELTGFREELSTVRYDLEATRDPVGRLKRSVALGIIRNDPRPWEKPREAGSYSVSTGGFGLEREYRWYAPSLTRDDD